MGLRSRFTFAQLLSLPLMGLAASLPQTAAAQADDAAIATALRECRQITNSVVRTGCYDAIPLGVSPTSSRPAPPEAPAVRQVPQAQAQPPAAALSFGQAQLPREPVTGSDEPKMLSARVASAQERQSGVYLLTLEDGAQWQFIESVSRSYDAPRQGSTVEIHRAAMGSYLMQYGGQKGIRIQRVR